MSDFDIGSRPPFINPIENFGYQAYSVVKISNIPFSVTVAEIKQLVKSTADHTLIEDHMEGYAVHIIMERNTGKTLECYVEFKSQGAAEDIVSKVQKRNTQGRAVKIGTRHVKFAVSSCGEVAAAVFPRAHRCHWDPVTGLPKPQVDDPFCYESFRGFLTIEEMLNVVKLAEVPQRSLIINRSYQRPYESMITTLYKFPWRATHMYTVNSRDVLFTAYMHLLQILVSKVPPMTDPASIQHVGPHIERVVGLSHSLLMDFCFAGLNTPCFSLRQKCFIVQNCGSIGAGFGVELQAGGWPFQALYCPRNYPSEHLTTWLAIVEAGYKDIELGELVHGFEEFINPTRDDSGILIFVLTEAGKALQFNELIAIEAALMELMVEKGRVRWCLEHDVTYAPLKLSKLFTYHNDGDGINAAMHTPRLHDSKFALPSVENGSFEANMRPPKRKMGDNRKSAWYQNMEELTVPRRVVQSAFSSDPIFGNPWCMPPYSNNHDESHQESVDGFYGSQQVTDPGQTTTASRQAMSNAFDPAIPPFVPSQPWVGASTTRYSNTPPTHTPTGPRNQLRGQATFQNARAPRSDTSSGLGTSITNSPTPSTQERRHWSVETATASLGSPSPSRSPSQNRGRGSSQESNGNPAWGNSIWGPPAPSGSPDGQSLRSNLTAHITKNTISSRGSRSSSVRYNSISIQAPIREESETSVDGDSTGGVGEITTYGDA